MTSGETSARALAHFRSHLDKAWGDLETMLAGIWSRIQYGELLNPTGRPKGYRGTGLRNYLKDVCGARRTTKWGATAIRGDLDPAKKRHIIEFFDLVNEVPANELNDLLKACGALYAQTVNAVTSDIVIPALSSAQKTLVSALRRTGSVGKIQQGLVFAALTLENRLLQRGLVVATKSTHAGDLQSGVRGDIVLLDEQTIVASYEVKGHKLNQELKSQVLETHSIHSYPLFIVAGGFTPLTLQDELNALDNTFAVNLVDFLLTLMGELHVSTRRGLDNLIPELISIYNTEFCEAIEQDTSIVIQIVGEM